MSKEIEPNSTLENSIRVSAKVMYLHEQSSAAARRYVFSYTITIENRGSENVQLMTRNWLITDADG